MSGKAMRWASMGIAAAFFCVFGAGMAVADEAKAEAKSKAKLEIGQAMPDFELQDAEGKTHKLSDYKDKIVVLDFCSKNCPVSRQYDPEISNVAEDYKDKGVVLLGIDSDKTNDHASVAAYMKEKNLKYTVLKDPENKYADAVNAKHTPEIFIVKDGKLVYHGGPDNQKKSGSPDYKNHLRAALDDLVAGREVAMAKTQPFGCAIKRVDTAKADKADKDS